MGILSSIRGRLMASVFLLSAVAVFLGAFGLMKATNLRDRMYLIAGPIAERARLTDEVDLQLINYIRMQKNIILATNDEQRVKFQAQQSDFSAAFDAALNNWEKIASDKGQEDIQDIRAAFDEYKGMNRQVVTLARSGHADQAQALSVSKSFEIFARIRKPLDASKKRASDDLAQQRDETTVLYRNLCWSLGIAILLGVGFGLTMGWLVVNETVRRLNRVRDYMRDVAEGEGDLTKRIPITHEDELGAVATWVNHFLDGMEEIIASVAENTAKIASSAGQIASSTRHIADSSRQQDSKASEVSRSMQQMALSVTEVSHNSEQAAETAQQAGAAAQSGSHTVNNTVTIMEEISAASHESAKAIQQLDQSSEKIGKIVAVIDDIASQTGLLALNAAIEAARAGTQGRGFAVVAGEVRQLADRTTTATKEIGQMIADVQQTTQRAVSAMDEGTRKVSHGVEVALQCTTEIEQITTRAAEVENMILQIAAAATEQSHSTGEVNSSMESIAVMVRDSSASAEQSAEACEQLAALAIDLQQLVGRFKTGASGNNGSVTAR
jgi:methyl-accepting chemotaxis protein